MNEITQVYEDYNARHNAAYSTFKQTYELENPRPTADQISRDIVSLVIVIALLIVSVAAIIVSGSRTIDEFGGEGIGTVAFVMIEGGIMAYSFFIARRNANKQRLQKTVKWAASGLVLTFIIGVGANIDASLKHKGIVLPTEVSIVINLLVAISAPALAFISSDVLAIELMATEIRRREALEINERRLAKWKKGLDTAWAERQKQWLVKIKIEKPDSVPKQLSAVSIPDGQRTDSGHGYGVGYTKRTDARTKILAYLDANPEASTLTARELAAAIGVGKSTVADTLKELKADKNTPIDEAIQEALNS